MLGFLCRHLQPVLVESLGHAAIAPDGIERQVDGIELDMRDGVQQDGAALGRGGRAPAHGGMDLELGLGRVAGQGDALGDRQLRLGCY